MTAFPPPPFLGQGVTIVRGLCPLHVVVRSFLGRPCEGAN